MNLTFQQVFSYFSTYKPSLFSNAKEPVLLTDTKLIIKNQTEFQSDILYVGNSSLLSEFESIISCKKANLLLINDVDIAITEHFHDSTSVIELSKDADLFMVFNETNDLFTKKLHLVNSSAVLLDSLINGKGLNYITVLGSEILNNPIILIDSSYKVLSAAKSEYITDTHWIKNIAQGYCSYEFIAEVKKIDTFKNSPNAVEPFYVTCSSNEVIKLVSKVIIDNKVFGYLVVFEYFQQFSDNTQEVLQLLSNVISQELSRSEVYKNMKGLMYENLLLDLLDEKIVSEDVVLDRTKTADYKFSDQLYLLAIDLSKYKAVHSRSNYLRDSLESIFINLKSVFYRDMIIILIDLKNNMSFDEYLRNEFKSFLKNNKLKGGISSNFSNLLELRKRYMESLKAIEFGSELKKDEHLFFYDEFKVYHLISSSNEKETLQKFCHPALIKLLKYDEDNNKDYFTTLLSFLSNNMNIKKTAEELFIHRNTLNYRINRICELIHLDLSDSEVIFQINLSYKIVQYLKHFN